MGSYLMRPECKLCLLLQIVAACLSTIASYHVTVVLEATDGNNATQLEAIIGHWFRVEIPYAELQLRTVFIDLNETATVSGEWSQGGNPLRLTQDDVCSRIINDSIAVILVGKPTEDSSSWQRISSTVSYSLGFYRVPVISTRSRRVEFSDKSVYPTFMRTVPTWVNEVNVWIRLLQMFDFGQVVLIYTNEVNSIAFATRFRDLAETYKIVIQQEMELQSGEFTYVSQLSLYLESTSNVYLLHSGTADARVIFRDAAKLNMAAAGKAWIVNELAVEADNIPQGVIGVRLDLTDEQSLRDAFRTVTSGFARLVREERLPLNLFESCDEQIADNEQWIVHKGFEFFRYLREVQIRDERSKTELAYNLYGDRIGCAYEVINFHGTSDEIGGSLFTVVGRYLIDEQFERAASPRLVLNANLIVWPGDKAEQPNEVTLPTQLLSVVVEDPPFVYKLPRPKQPHHRYDTDTCFTLSDKPPSFFNGSHIPPVGPWVQCKNSSTGQDYCCTGLSIDLLWRLSKSQAKNDSYQYKHFSFNLELVDLYGAPVRTPSGVVWSGMLGRLVSGTADLAIGALSVNPERERAIDFTNPWLYHGITIMQKKQKRTNPMQSFMQPFQWGVWVSLFASVVVVGICLYFLDHCSPFKFFGTPPTDICDEDELSLNLSGAMWFVWGVLLDSGIGESKFTHFCRVGSPRSFSGRVLGVVWCGFSMIMVASYTANLAAYLVLDQPVKSLTGISDPRLRNPSANFTFATLTDSNVYMYFKRRPELSTMFRKMEGMNYATADAAVQATIDGELGAFIWDSTRLEFETARHCDLVTPGTLFGRSAYAIGLPKHSPWTTPLTLAILKLGESGQMEELHSKWISGSKLKQSSACIDHESMPVRLGLTNMRDLFILVAAGIVVGAMLSVVEVVYKRRKATQLRKRQLAMSAMTVWREKTLRAHPTPTAARLAPLAEEESAAEPCLAKHAHLTNNDAPKRFSLRKPALPSPEDDYGFLADGAALRRQSGVIREELV